MVHIQDLSLAFGEQVLFEHLDLTLLPNEWVSLLGCSGVGKSTLLRLIAGLEIQGKIQGNIIFHPNIRVAWLPQKDTLVFQALQLILKALIYLHQNSQVNPPIH